jgi:hypothetical protein
MPQVEHGLTGSILPRRAEALGTTLNAAERSRGGAELTRLPCGEIRSDNNEQFPGLGSASIEEFERQALEHSPKSGNGVRRIHRCRS